MKHSGEVKWFNNSKGFGFITSPSVNEDIFVHYSQVQMEGYRQLKAKQPVVFDLADNNGKGYAAINVVL